MNDISPPRQANHFHKQYKDPGLPYNDGPKQVKHISKLLRLGLILFIPLAAFQAAITIYILVDMPGYISLVSFNANPDSYLLNTIYGLAIIYRLTYIYCIVMTCWFLFRAARNLNTVSPDLLKYSPHFAWAWFFIPFANFFKPYQMVTSIDRFTKEAAGSGTPANALIPTWWILFILSVFIGATDISFPIASVFSVALIADILSGALAIVAAVMFMQVTGEIAEHQGHLQSAGVAQVFD